MFLITGYTEEHTWLLRLYPTLTSGGKAGGYPGAKKILIYGATPHYNSDLNTAKCGPGTTSRNRQVWAVHMLKQVEQLPYVHNQSMGTPTQPHTRPSRILRHHMRPLR